MKESEAKKREFEKFKKAMELEKRKTTIPRQVSSLVGICAQGISETGGKMKQERSKSQIERERSREISRLAARKQFFEKYLTKTEKEKK